MTHRLAFSSRHLLDRVEEESFLLRCPDFTDPFVWREAVLRVWPPCEIFGRQDVGGVRTELGVTSATTLGLGAAGLKSLILAMLPGSAGVAGYIGAPALLTIKNALFQSANDAAAEAEQRSVISGLLGLARSFGLVIGATAMGALHAAACTTSAATGLHVKFAAAAAAALACMVHLCRIRSAARLTDVAP